MIETENLRLIPVERAHREAFQRSKRDLAALLGTRVPEHWPHFPEAMALPDAPAVPDAPPPEWEAYFYIHPADGVLVGDGGFKGPPDASGEVEIGHEIATEYWNRGFATEAAGGLIAFAFAHPEVTAVLAHTLAEPNASNNVLRKLGMTFDGELDDPEDGRVWRWRLRRADYRSTEGAA
jgi:RimJ/RimL family protein N-acetyltransferase